MIESPDYQIREITQAPPDYTLSIIRKQNYRKP